MRATTLRGSQPRSRALCRTVFVLTVLAACSFLTQSWRRLYHHSDQASSTLFKRHDEPTCDQVHSASDQCAFVKQYCQDDEAGLLPYLRLYYCAINHTRPLTFLWLVVWLGLLFTTIGIAASDFFSINLSTISSILGLSESLAGVTFLAFGNGSPDVFSTFAAMNSNSPSLAVGELLGAACFITGVMAGSMALVREIRVDKKTYTRDIAFFIFAVIFTMVFLADGWLHFWECAIMICYYLLYVITVVGWHWYSKGRRRRLRREGEARSHFYGMTASLEDELAGQPYRDEPDTINQESTPLLSRDGALDRNSRPFERALCVEDGADIPDREGTVMEDDETGDDLARMAAAEMTRSMRVLRVGSRLHHHHMNPIRPNLVGALEFRSALAHLRRESNLHLAPPGRNYSDNQLHGRSSKRDRQAPAPAGPLSSPVWEDASSLHDLDFGCRDRAFSSGNVQLTSGGTLKLEGSARGSARLLDPSQKPGTDQVTPSIVPSYIVKGKLAPPKSEQAGTPWDVPLDNRFGSNLPSQLRLEIPSRRSSRSDASSAAPFPSFADSPATVTPLGETELDHLQVQQKSSPHSDPSADLQFPVPLRRPTRWWPSTLLPPPQTLLAVLFPTLQEWRSKSLWDRFLGIVSVPVIFLLVITLPVVDSESGDSDICSDEVHLADPPQPPDGEDSPRAITAKSDEYVPEGEWERFRRHALSLGGGCHRPTSPGSPNKPWPGQTEEAVSLSTGRLEQPAKPGADSPGQTAPKSSRPQWNRWLVCVQLFNGPLLAVLVLWSNIWEDVDQPRRLLVRMILYTLLGSAVSVVILLGITSEYRRPRFHYLLCFPGFLISIAWISTVAAEVVGVLKAFGIILEISEALLGLTVFAAGNSIGDLVANITMARLGYPVMALSACFGGPLLNILLGIGLGGVMMMIRGANHKHGKHHSERPSGYAPYRVEVAGTLLISSVTLLVMLISLLLLVPMNRWVLSRRIGWGLISLWIISTILNLTVELTDIWD